MSALPDLAGWSIRDSCRWAALWGDSELQLVAAGDSSESEPVVSEIAVLGSTTGPRPQTDSGVGVGSTEEQVRAAYPGAAEGTSGYGPVDPHGRSRSGRCVLHALPGLPHGASGDGDDSGQALGGVLRLSFEHPAFRP